jgi:hypothetical protein
MEEVARRPVSLVSFVLKSTLNGSFVDATQYAALTFLTVSLDS